MQKAFRNSLILGITLIICLGILCACDKPNENNDNDKNDFPAKMGEFYTLQEAYDQGLITRENLLNIAYYQNGSINEENFIPIPKNPQKLSPEIEFAIKQTYAYDFLNTNNPNYNSYPSGQDVVGYYGTYNNCIAVMINKGWFQVIWEEEIENVYFHYNDSNQIRIWKSNELLIN